MLMDEDEKIHYRLKPSRTLLVKKHKKERRNSGISLFKWCSTLLVLLIAPIIIFPNFFTEILPQFFLDPNNLLGGQSDFWEGMAMIACIYFFIACMGGGIFMVLYLVGAVPDLMPINFLISWKDDRELIITNKKLIEIRKNKDFSFHFYEDMHESGSCREVYSVIIKSDFGNHLAIAEFQFNNLDPSENLEEIQAFLREQFKKIYPDARFSDKSWYEQEEES